MKKRDTKELIWQEALKLFSDYGYEGVGIRDISKRIEITQGAIYKHYKSKQEIFDTIISKMNKRYDDFISTYRLPVNIENDIQSELIHTCYAMFEFYLKDEHGAQLRRLLAMEQYKNTLAGIVFREQIIDGGLIYIQSIYDTLIEKGYYKDGDSYIMAIQFYAPLYLLLNKFDRQPERYDEALALLKNHIQQFDLEHKK